MTRFSFRLKQKLAPWKNTRMTDFAENQPVT